MEMLNDFLQIADKLNFELSTYLLVTIGIVLSIVAVKLSISSKLLDNVAILSLFSLLISILYLLMDAPDVAMTEVALGSCLSSCVLLNFLKSIKASNQKLRISKTVPAFILSSLFFLTLIYISSFLPEYGDQNAPIHGHVSKYYIDNTKHEVGTPSIAAAILASYRGYDTLGETSVILIAGLAILLILSPKIFDKPISSMTNQLNDSAILRIITHFIVPYIFLYGLYIQINGEVSPGGGFQAGVIFASCIIALDLVSERNLQLLLSIDNLRYSAVAGVLIYALTGVVSLALGANYLNYSVFSPIQINGQIIGIITIELGVGITVSSVMTMIYFLFYNNK